MQRYLRDLDRDDEGGRSERGSQARSEDRYAQQGSRDQRGEFGGREDFGSRRDPGNDRNINEEASAYGMNPGSNRWRESGAERERFEQSYGRGGQQSDHYTGGSFFGGRQRHEDDRDNSNEQAGRSAWQPGGAFPPGGERRGSYPQYGETEYGVYGPRYGGGDGGRSGYGRNRSDPRYGGYGYGDYGYGEERGDDRQMRQGYGQSRWQHDPERGEHHMDLDYQQWRAEQIRNLDADYRTYRQERYRKFSEEFDSWRKNRESMNRPSSQSGMGQSGIGQTGQSAMGFPSGQSASAGIASSQESTTRDVTVTARDSLGMSKNNK